MDKWIFKESGSFIVGCNYWASHAGTAMWTDWKPEVMDNDLKKLAGVGIQVIRVFPLWPVFQPINLLYKFLGKPAEFRHGEEPLPDDEGGRAGISPEAFKRFEEFVKLAHKYNIKLIVGLITGWMSGRLFVPPAFEGKNTITDTAVIKWEVRYVKYFVKYFSSSDTIIAWDLGNECNCMGEVENREDAWLWTSCIADAIRTVDRSRPVISGMHSLSLTGKWTIEDQAELTDILTTHPYPAFTPYCDQDPLNTIRTLLHATAESCYYKDIGGKPCFVEEMGTLNPMMGDDYVTASFLRSNLFSLWAHDCRGLLWWCNHDQVHLKHAPYDWSAGERELGLFRVDGTSKPIMDEITKFRKFLDQVPFKKLPPRHIDGICILSADQDNWGVAYSSFILAKQAGIDIRFGYENNTFEKAQVYLLPCISGFKVISRRRWMELMERVEQGAILYISHYDGFLTEFERLTGIRVLGRQRRRGLSDIVFDINGDRFTLEVEGPVKLSLKPVCAETVATEPDGNPAFCKALFGKGKVYFMSFPIEIHMARHPEIFHANSANPCWKLYRYIFSDISGYRVIEKTSPFAGVTEHELEYGKRIIVIINYSPLPLLESLRVSKGWDIGRVIYGQKPVFENGIYKVQIHGNDAVVFTIDCTK